MLTDLKVKNFAIIKDLHIEFKKKFNVISGETGAGKSILLRSLSLLMGGKALSNIVRSGEDLAVVEGRFDLNGRLDIHSKLSSRGFEVEEDEALIVRRTISAKGKGKIYLNGQLSSLSDLKAIVLPLVEIAGDSAPLIEMTGQHDNKQLLTKAYHRELLDLYANSKNSLETYQKVFLTIKDVQKQISEIEEGESEREKQIDYLNYQVQEIESFKLTPEDFSLSEELETLKQSKKVEEIVEKGQALFNDNENSVLEVMQTWIFEAQEFTEHNSTLREIVESMEAAKIQIEDNLYLLKGSVHSDNLEESDIDSLLDRISSLRLLQKKHGETFEDVNLQFVKLKEERDQLVYADKIKDELLVELESLKKEAFERSAELHQVRKNAAFLLENSVNDELLDLNMKGVELIVNLKQTEELNKFGCSDIEFYVTHAGPEEARPLNKTASGGELSRMLLSIKTVMGQSELPRSYLFDEVDAGVSGPTAEKVGKKLQSLSLGQQVICVTHLPQVAAQAHHHFYIFKDKINDEIQMQVKELRPEERIHEVARLVSGEEMSESSLSHAKNLISTYQ